MTIVPLMVVADNISGLKNTGTVPNIVTATIAIRPFRTVAVWLFPKSITINLEKELKVLSSVEAAEVIIIKFIMSIMPTPNTFAHFYGCLPFHALHFSINTNETEQ